MPILPPSRPRSPIAVGLAVGCAGAVLLAVLTTTELYASLMAEHEHFTLGHLFVMELVYWSPWILIAPIIVLLGSRYRLETGHLRTRVPIWVAAAIAAGIAHSVLLTMLGRVGLPVMPMWGATGHESIAFEIRHRFTSAFAGNVLVFLIAVLLYHSLVYYGAYRDRVQRESELQAELARFHLHVLRAQLQPHFLFNTLNTVSALMAEDVAAARRVLAQLADLLRISLDQMGRREVRVEEEVDFLRRYIDIHRARFGDRFSVDWAIDDTVRTALLPSMVLQPCVENAIRHGIEPRGAGGHITIAARASDGRLLLDITDNGPGARPQADGRPGMGLVNVRARLETLYGDDHAFEAGNGSAGGFHVRVAIPLVQSDGAGDGVGVGAA